MSVLGFCCNEGRPSCHCVTANYKSIAAIVNFCIVLGQLTWTNETDCVQINESKLMLKLC